MNPKVKLAAYAVLIILSVLFAHGFYTNYSAATQDVPDIGSTGPAAMPDDGTPASSNSPAPATSNVASNMVSNATATAETNAAAESVTNTSAEPNTNTVSEAGTNVVAVPDTHAITNTLTNAQAKVHKKRHKKIALPPPDVRESRSSMITYLAAFVGSMIGLGLLVAYDVTQIAGTQVVDFLFNDAGEGQRDPEYERAEHEWANGKFLDAIQLMRDFLKKHPREIYAALRIAEIYEKDLKNPLAAALEYEEVLKQKLPPERWGWAAIHLCNLYSKLNKSDNAVALLRRIADEYPKTGAAKKARVRLGIAEPELSEVVEEVALEAESEATGETHVVTMEEHPPELEPRRQFLTEAPEAQAPAETEKPKPSLPPGFRKKQ
jgi:TolA-binding protein